MSKKTPKKPKPDTEQANTKKKKKNSYLRLLMFALFLLLSAVVVSAVYIVGIYYYSTYKTSAPISYADLMPKQYVSYIYDYRGNEIDKLHGEENREYAAFSELPYNLVNAVVAIEDSRFFEHPGIDAEGILRAVYVNLQEGEFVEGASTITQQLVKNNLLNDTSVRLQRKIEEQCLAVKLERDLTSKLGTKRAAKDFIMEQYLNSINFAHGINGVKLAARYYFGKELKDLTLTECASLAAIIKNPVRFSIENSKDSNWERTQTVLLRMAEQQFISYTEYVNALNENIYGKKVFDADDNQESVHSYFVDQVINEVARDLMYEKGIDKANAYKLVYGGGLRIFTTYDPEIQQIIDEGFSDDSLFPSSSELTVNITFDTIHGVVRKMGVVGSDEEADRFVRGQREMLENQGYNVEGESVQKVIQPQGAFVIIDYRTGHVPAFGAGRGEKKYNMSFNRATQAERQPGSCFKVLAAYLPAIDSGNIAANSLVEDAPITVDDYTPNNYDFNYRGMIPIRTAIRDSINVAAVRTLVGVGYKLSYDYLKKLGFTTLVESRPNANGKEFTDLGPALALGGLTDGVTPLELAAAYGAIANKGQYTKPVFYTKVVSHDGTVLLENTVRPNQVIKPATSYALTDMMEDVVKYGTGTQARFRSISLPIAGKTGTSQDDKDLMFCGYTPYYVASVWQGYDIPQELHYNTNYHLLLWSSLMERIHQLKGYTSGDFDIPADMTDEQLGRNAYQ